MNITRLSIDLAKDIFQLYGVDSKQKCVLTKRITGRAKLRIAPETTPYF